MSQIKGHFPLRFPITKARSRHRADWASRRRDITKQHTIDCSSSMTTRPQQRTSQEIQHHTQLHGAPQRAACLARSSLRWQAPPNGDALVRPKTGVFRRVSHARTLATQEMSAATARGIHIQHFGPDWCNRRPPAIKSRDRPALLKDFHRPNDYAYLAAAPFCHDLLLRFGRPRSDASACAVRLDLLVPRIAGRGQASRWRYGLTQKIVFGGRSAVPWKMS